MSQPPAVHGHLTFQLSVPSNAEYAKIIRLAMAGLGAAVGLDLHSIEDLKLAVSEVCYTMYTGLSDDRILLTMTAASDELVVFIDHSSPRGVTVVDYEPGLGNLLVEHLVDRVERSPGGVCLTILVPSG